MAKAKFQASQFTATKFEDASAKARFCHQFVRFVESDFKFESFPKWFYTRLSMTFGHIAHYNQMGFYETFFKSTNNIVYFLQETLKYPSYGSPGFTYCDAEKAIQEWLKENKVFEKWVAKLNAEIEATERAQLAHLQSKYS